MSEPAAQAPPPIRPALRWFLVWALLTLIYVSAVLLHRAVSGAQPAWWTLGREDLAHLGLVPLVETGALALVARLRRRP